MFQIKTTVLVFKNAKEKYVVLIVGLVKMEEIKEVTVKVIVQLPVE
ncbi:hypothetical protein [Solibacillus sp. FSL W7-1324]